MQSKPMHTLISHMDKYENRALFVRVEYFRLNKLYPKNCNMLHENIESTRIETKIYISIYYAFNHGRLLYALNIYF